MSFFRIATQLLPGMLEQGTEIHYPDGRIATITKSEVPPGVGAEDAPGVVAVSLEVVRRCIRIDLDDDSEEEFSVELRQDVPEGWTPPEFKEPEP